MVVLLFSKTTCVYVDFITHMYIIVPIVCVVRGRQR